MHALGYDAGLGRALKRAIERRIRFHDLRHNRASHLVQGTWSPQWSTHALRLEEVKAWLDHSDIGVTQRCAHLAPDAIRGKVADPGKNTGDKEAADRPTNWSHLRDLNSRPTVYESEKALSQPSETTENLAVSRSAGEAPSAIVEPAGQSRGNQRVSDGGEVAPEEAVDAALADAAARAAAAEQWSTVDRLAELAGVRTGRDPSAPELALALRRAAAAGQWRTVDRLASAIRVRRGGHAEVVELAVVRGTPT